MLLRHRYLTSTHGKPVEIPRRPNTAVERLVYSTLITIFDTLDVVLCWARPFDKKTENRVCTYSLPSFTLISCFRVAHRV